MSPETEELLAGTRRSDRLRATRPGSPSRRVGKAGRTSQHTTPRKTSSAHGGRERANRCTEESTLWLPGQPVPRVLLPGPNRVKTDKLEAAFTTTTEQFSNCGLVVWPYRNEKHRAGITVPLADAFGEVPALSDVTGPTVTLTYPRGVVAEDVRDELSFTNLLLADGRVLAAHLGLDMGVNKPANLPRRLVGLDNFLPYLRLTDGARLMVEPDIVQASLCREVVAVGEAKWAPKHRSSTFGHRQVLLPALAAQQHFGPNVDVVPVFVLATSASSCLVATVDYPDNDLPGARLDKVTQFVFTDEQPPVM